MIVEVEEVRRVVYSVRGFSAINHPELSTCWFKTAVHQRLSASISGQGFLVPTLGQSPQFFPLTANFWVEIDVDLVLENRNLVGR